MTHVQYKSWERTRPSAGKGEEVDRKRIGRGKGINSSVVCVCVCVCVCVQPAWIRASSQGTCHSRFLYHFTWKVRNHEVSIIFHTVSMFLD